MNLRWMPFVFAALLFGPIASPPATGATSSAAITIAMEIEQVDPGLLLDFGDRFYVDSHEKSLNSAGASATASRDVLSGGYSATVTADTFSNLRLVPSWASADARTGGFPLISIFNPSDTALTFSLLFSGEMSLYAQKSGSATANTTGRWHFDFRCARCSEATPEPMRDYMYYSLGAFGDLLNEASYSNAYSFTLDWILAPGDRFYVDGDAQVDTYASSVPEPANYLMVMLGLGVVGFFSRRPLLAVK